MSSFDGHELRTSGLCTVTLAPAASSSSRIAAAASYTAATVRQNVLWTSVVFVADLAKDGLVERRGELDCGRGDGS